jgi:magnesium transporter
MSEEPKLRIVATRGEEGLLRGVAPAEVPRLLAEEGVTVWIDAWGADVESAERLARDVFHYHPLMIEDCFTEREHPKIDGFSDHLFLITHGLGARSTVEKIEVIELDVFLGKNYLFTYHEHPSRSISAAMELVERNHGGPLRRGPAALLYTILERQVDSITPFLESIDEQIEELGDCMIEHPARRDLARLLAIQRATLHMRRWAFRQREVMLRLSRNEFQVVPQKEAILFRDVYDHLHLFTDQLENQREMIATLQQTYLSVINLRLGEVMKFLTIFTAVLMPLTVITGIYGMNFVHMPELKLPWAYPALLGVMGATALAILWSFRRKGWIGEERSEPPRSGG